MKGLIKLAGLTAVAGLGAATVAGCGSDVPPNAVAKVGDSVVKKSEFDKWLRTAALGQAQGGGKPTVPDPPRYKACVAAQQAAPSPKGAPKVTPAQALKQCKQEYTQLKGQVMQFLIQAQWIQQAAAAHDVKVSDAEVRRSFEDQKKQAFPSEKAFRRFLETSGMTEADILFRIKLQTLQTKLSQKVTENEGKVTNADIGDYYDKNKKRFAQPERRSLSVVVTKTKSKAKQARARLAAGKSFKVVAKRFSIDDASKRQGGKLPSLAKGQQDRTLDKAVFGAKKGVLVGPVKTQFGWYVFKVTKVTPASQQSLSQARETIRNVLRQERQQKALDHFVKNFRSDYKDKTTCAKGFQIAECKNGPKRASTGPASGGAPQGGSPAGPQGTPQPTPTPAPQTPPGR